MTSLLHLETNSVQFCAEQMAYRGDVMQDNAQRLIASVRSLDWYGPNRDQFQREAESLIQKILLLADDGQILTTRLRREILEWEELDILFQKQFSQIIVVPFQRDKS